MKNKLLYKLGKYCSIYYSSDEEKNYLFIGWYNGKRMVNNIIQLTGEDVKEFEKELKA